MVKNEKKVVERKKNKSTKSAIVLFGAVLITTSLLGGTLAKYVSDVGKADDSARVAKWGLTPQNQTIDLFDYAYVPVGDGNTKDGPDYNNLATDTVVSKDRKKVVAPGTKGEGILVPVLSDAELNNVEVAFTVSITYGDYVADSVFAKYAGDWKAIGTAPGDGETDDRIPWWPLRFSIYGYNKTNKKYDTSLYDGIVAKGSGAANPAAVDDGGQQFDGLNNALKGLNSGTMTSAVIYPEDTLTVKKEKIAAIGVKIAWEWPFVRPETGTEDAVNAWDTVVGNRAADASTSADDMPKFLLSAKYTVQQVD